MEEQVRLRSETEKRKRYAELALQKEAEALALKQEQAEKTLSERERLESYLQVTSLQERVEYAVVVLDPEGRALPEFTTKLQNVLEKDGVSLATGIFADAFSKTEAFEVFFSGRGGKDLQAMPVSRFVEKTLLGRYETLETHSSSEVPGLYRTNASLHIHILNPCNGQIMDRMHFKTIGPGADESLSRTSAFNRIVEHVVKREW